MGNYNRLLDPETLPYSPISEMLKHEAAQFEADDKTARVLQALEAELLDVKIEQEGRDVV